MPSNFRTPRGGKQTATSITTSQRSSCEAIFYRWRTPDITKVEKLNVSNDRSLGGEGAASAQGNLEEREPVIIRNDIVQCVVNKNKAGPTGNFTLMLKRGKQVDNGEILQEDIDYTKALHPGDWVMIYIKKSERVNVFSTRSDSGLKFFGIVENVRYVETDNPEKGFPSLYYLVTGTDFGKVFNQDIYFNPIVNNETIQSLLGAKFLTDSNNSLKGESRTRISDFSADRIVKNIISFYLGGDFDDLNRNNQTWYVPPRVAAQFGINSKKKRTKASFVDILNTDKMGLHRYNRNNVLQEVNPLPGRALIKSLPSEGTVWAIMEFLQNRALNEMYTELSDDGSGSLRPSVVLRQYPFSNFPNEETNVLTLNARSPNQGGKGVSTSDDIPQNQKTFFTTLPRKTIVSSDIKNKNVGKSDHERLNHFIIVPRIDSQTYDQLYMTALNIPSIQRYGLRSIQTQTAYVLGEDQDGLKNYLKRCVGLTIDWFFNAHMLYNGTIIVDGFDDHVEVGTNLYIADINQLYHIEGYSHKYQIRQDGKITYTTEMRVSRGQILEGNRSYFIGPSTAQREPTTISTSVLEGTRGRNS